MGRGMRRSWRTRGNSRRRGWARSDAEARGAEGPGARPWMGARTGHGAGARPERGSAPGPPGAEWDDAPWGAAPRAQLPPGPGLRNGLATGGSYRRGCGTRGERDAARACRLGRRMGPTDGSHGWGLRIGPRSPHEPQIPSTRKTALVGAAPAPPSISPAPARNRQPVPDPPHPDRPDRRPNRTRAPVPNPLRRSRRIQRTPTRPRGPRSKPPRRRSARPAPLARPSRRPRTVHPLSPERYDQELWMRIRERRGCL